MGCCDHKLDKLHTLSSQSLTAWFEMDGLRGRHAIDDQLQGSVGREVRACESDGWGGGVSVGEAKQQHREGTRASFNDGCRDLVDCVMGMIAKTTTTVLFIPSHHELADLPPTRSTSKRPVPVERVCPCHTSCQSVQIDRVIEVELKDRGVGRCEVGSLEGDLASRQGREQSNNFRRGKGGRVS